MSISKADSLGKHSIADQIMPIRKAPNEPSL